MTEQAVVIDMTQGRNREFFHLAQMKMCLSIQATTGLRHSRGSVIKLYNQKYGTSFRTAKTALRDCQARMDKITDELMEDPA